MYRLPPNPFDPNPPQVRSRAFRHRDPFVAAALSFWCCGLGQIYCGHVTRGLALMGLTAVGPVLAILIGFRLGDLAERAGGDFGTVTATYALAAGFLACVFWLAQVVDAWRLAERS